MTSTWTRHEIIRLKRMYSGVRVNEISMILGKKPSEVLKMAIKLGYDKE